MSAVFVDHGPQSPFGRLGVCHAFPGGFLGFGNGFLITAPKYLFPLLCKLDWAGLWFVLLVGWEGVWYLFDYRCIALHCVVSPTFMLLRLAGRLASFFWGGARLGNSLTTYQLCDGDG